MATVDFTGWVAPDLVVTLGGRTYKVPPPSVDEAKLILALAVRTETQLGLSTSPLGEDLEALLETVVNTPLGEITLLGGVYEEMKRDKVAAATIDRVAYYALHFWARGKVRADRIAELMWTPALEDGAGEVEDSGEANRR